MGKKNIKSKRNYTKKTTAMLFGLSAAHCTICNRALCYDKYSHTNRNSAEIAHIRAFSDLGPRADVTLSEEERNDISNLILLCGQCHSQIDQQIEDGIYTIEWLKCEKEKKEKDIRNIMQCLTPGEAYCLKMVSPIHNIKINVDDKQIREVCFHSHIHVKEEVISLDDGFSKESYEINNNALEKNIVEKLNPILQGTSAKPLCIFGFAPQYLLIKLGYKLSDQNEYFIFTKHRDGWILNKDINEENHFNIIKPKVETNNKVALIISSTAKIHHERVYEAIGDDVDIWELEASKIGQDNINNLTELNEFQKQCASILDEIGYIYGKNKSICLFPAMCNSLAIKFGQSIFHKKHTKIKLFDSQVDENGIARDVETIII